MAVVKEPVHINFATLPTRFEHELHMSFAVDDALTKLYDKNYNKIKKKKRNKN